MGRSLFISKSLKINQLINTYYILLKKARTFEWILPQKFSTASFRLDPNILVTHAQADYAYQSIIINEQIT